MKKTYTKPIYQTIPVESDMHMMLLGSSTAPSPSSSPSFVRPY